MTGDQYIAVIVCDTIIPGFEEFGDFGDLGIKLLQNGGMKLNFKKYHAILEELPSSEDILKIKGFYITGSRSDSFSDDGWILKLIEFIRSIVKIYHKPIVGVCFGAQIINIAFGGKVCRNPQGWEAGIQKIKLNENLSKNFFFKNYFKKNINLIEMHKDYIYSLPDEKYDFINIGSTIYCKIQGIYSLKCKILTVQGHPEFSKQFSNKIIELVFRKTNPELCEKFLEANANSENEGALIGESFVNFLMNE
ncbi:hypothetical protein PACTADRAFT_35866 [Pachysolen tannophilus NRRL Y-2460]|uniref:Glutamine amidotransferase domain-containing protein n=1 Tax=Pachysolen tannophilus NRRL Y-2460 TaxID=669874 RepID=A0A1E4TN91_PACTA|nr:hypothetical protein PACTADRAFT_35866 [Pachysolen tannophilus NRRL Y-2460]